MMKTWILQKLIPNPDPEIPYFAICGVGILLLILLAVAHDPDQSVPDLGSDL